MTRVGLIGLGLMGEPMGKNWLQKGFSLSVLPHKNQEPALRLKSLGANVCSNLSDLVSESDAIVLMLPSSREVEALCLTGSQNIMELGISGQTVVDMSTSDPASTRRIGHELKRKNISFVDAPVTGGVLGAANGTLTLFMGGDAPVIEKIKPLLSAVSQKQVHFGALGSGHVAKAINNLICIGNLVVFCEALPLAKFLGLDPKLLMESLLGGMADSAVLKFYVPQIMKSDFAPRFKLEHAYKDLVIAHRMAEFAGVELPVLEGMLQHFHEAEKEGLVGQNISSIIRPIEKSLGVEFRG